MFLTLITFIVVLSLLVFVHELGHFWTARRFGLVPEEFGFGFPPRALGIYKDKEGKWRVVKGKKQVSDAQSTVYSINWLPLGGFVKLGEDDMEVNPEANHFHNKKIWQRMVILLAGVTMNVVLAAVLISFGFMIGLPQALDDDIRARANVSDEQVQIVEILPDSPAAAAELKMGDFVISVDGQAVTKSTALTEYTAANQGRELEYVFNRGGEEIKKTIVPAMLVEADTAGIGIGIVETGLVRYPIHLAIWEGVKTTIFTLIAIIMAFYGIIKGLLVGQGPGADIAGPVGIAVLTGQVARLGFVYILQFAAMLSINLAIINGFPFPALDGGRVLFLIIEKIKGSPVKREVEGTIHYIGFALLMALVLLVTFKDLSRFGETWRMIWDKLF